VGGVQCTNARILKDIRLLKRTGNGVAGRGDGPWILLTWSHRADVAPSLSISVKRLSDDKSVDHGIGCLVRGEYRTLRPRLEYSKPVHSALFPRHRLGRIEGPITVVRYNNQGSRSRQINALLIHYGTYRNVWTLTHDGLPVFDYIFVYNESWLKKNMTIKIQLTWPDLKY